MIQPDFGTQDPYFPHGIIDLRYAISCEPTGDKDFRLRTHQKTVVLSADSIPSREEWVKAIRKVIFKAQNMGDTVKVFILDSYMPPLSNEFLDCYPLLRYLRG